MTKKFKVIYLSLFYEDIEKIVDYMIFKLKNEIVARNFIDEVENAIKERANNPNYYEKYYSRKERKDTYYRIYVNNYIIFYVIKDNIMEVRRILYNRMNFDRFI